MMGMRLDKEMVAVWASSMLGQPQGGNATRTSLLEIGRAVDELNAETAHLGDRMSLLEHRQARMALLLSDLVGILKGPQSVLSLLAKQAEDEDADEYNE